ncbi:MAG: helix-turn-helix domain-containing protein [Acidimicrobiales bacterium]
MAPIPKAQTVGDLVCHYRRQKDWSRAYLAKEVHRSVSWVSHVERDEIEVTNTQLLGRLAAVFGAPLVEFFIASMGPDAAELVRDRPYVEVVRRAIAGHPVAGLLGSEAGSGISATDLDQLEVRTRRAWELVHASSYKELGPMLARLISDLETASRVAGDADTVRILTSLADAYQVAAAMLVKVGDHGAAWVAADRAIRAGERCDDRGLILAGQLRMARTLLGSKDRGLAHHVLTRGVSMANDVENSADPGLISLVGACALLLGVLEATEHKSQAAQRNLVMAAQLANRLGSDRNFYGTEFGPTNVAVHAVAIAVELGNGQQALDRAKRVTPRVLSPERQARFLVDVARAHLLTGTPRDAVTALLHAEQIAPEELVDLGMVATVIEDIEDQTKHRRIPAVRELKRRLYS